MNTVVSIVIPAHNGAAFLDATIDSVVAQTMPAWELTVVDDGSTDATAEIASGRAEQDARIRLVRRPVPSGSACPARNEGLRRSSSRSPFALFLDHDDLLEPTALDRLMDVLARHPDASAVHGLVQRIDAAGNVLRAQDCDTRWEVRGGRVVRLAVDEPTTYETLATNCCIHSPGCVLVRRSALRDRRLFLETDRLVLDWDGWLGLSASASMAFLPEVVLSYRETPGSMSADRGGMRERMRATRLRTSRREILTPAQREYILRAAPLVDTFQAREKLAYAARALTAGRLREAGLQSAYAFNCWRRARSWRGADEIPPVGMAFEDENGRAGEVDAERVPVASDRSAL